MQADASVPSWISLASPAPGRPLVVEVERLGSALRALAAGVSESLDVTPDQFNAAWAPRVGQLGYQQPTRVEVSSRAAWCLIGAWLCGYAKGAVELTDTLSDAHEWFSGRAGNLGAIAVPALRPDWGSSPPTRQKIHALLPYLLDTEVAATRRQVLNGKAQREDRDARKSAGVYLTPGDLAHFMVSTLRGSGSDRWLDPACGSGVFLRSIVSQWPLAHVYGVDINPSSADLAPFVLMTERATPGLDPSTLWHLERLNLVTGDALLVTMQRHDGALAFGEERKAVSTALHNGILPPAVLSPAGCGQDSSSWPLPAAFPELQQGADVVVQNPPYARPESSKLQAYERVWDRSIGSNVYPLFLEAGLSLLTDDGQMAAVVPSSFVAASTANILSARGALAACAGDVELLSFDRMPDGLFGDDIKTRCSIVLLDRSAPAGLRVGPMQKITVNSRSSALVRGSSPDLPVSVLTERLLPKVRSSEELILLEALSAVPRTVVSTAQIQRATHADLESSMDTVVVGPTAYNWIGVQREPAAAIRLGHTSTHPVYALQAMDDGDADALYAVLCSRITYWLWRVYGDGFHVNSWLFARVPAWTQEDSRRQLSKLGVELWTRRLATPSTSLNGGKTTIAFPPLESDGDLLDEIDGLLFDELGLSVAPVNLRAWVRETVLTGRNSVRGLRP